jgi:hypothetical protein
MKALLAVTALVAVVVSAPALAQDKPSVSGYLAQGFQVVHSEMGNPFLQFILKKDNQLVWCSVTLSSGETQSCRTIK